MDEFLDFKIEKLLGTGGTAQVYQARKKSDQSVVALKVFHPGLWDQKLFRKRANDEFELASSLDHPNIVHVYETFLDHNPPAVSMEFVEGQSLEQFQGKLPYVFPEISVYIVIEILKAIEYAHARNIIHRDLKPGNILISTTGEIRVADFGLSKVLDVSRVTLSGTILGSPDFMAPEQARGDLCSFQSDLFSVAAILYFLVTGTKPFTRHTPLATLAAVIDGIPEPAQQRNPKISPKLAQIIHQGLSKQNSDRYSSAVSFRKTLESYLTSLGLTELDLKTWLLDTSEMTLTWMQLTSENLQKSGESHLESRSWNDLLDIASHLSQISPQNPSVPRFIQAYEKAQRHKKNFYRYKVAGICALILLGLIFLGMNFRKFRTPQVIPASINTPLPVAITKPVIPEPATRHNIPPVRKNTEKATEVRTTVSPGKSSGVVIFNIPKDIQVLWDEKEVDTNVPLKNQKFGPHKLRLIKPGRPDIVETIQVSEDEPSVIRVQ